MLVFGSVTPNSFWLHFCETHAENPSNTTSRPDAGRCQSTGCGTCGPTSNQPIRQVFHHCSVVTALNIDSYKTKVLQNPHGSYIKTPMAWFSAKILKQAPCLASPKTFSKTEKTFVRWKNLKTYRKKNLQYKTLILIVVIFLYRQYFSLTKLRARLSAETAPRWQGGSKDVGHTHKAHDSTQPCHFIHHSSMSGGI